MDGDDLDDWMVGSFDGYGSIHTLTETRGRTKKTKPNPIGFVHFGSSEKPRPRKLRRAKASTAQRKR